MLHFETLPAGGISVLKQLMTLEPLAEFVLVGGTALSLRHGHRVSVDLDLFGPELDKEALSAALHSEFGKDLRIEPMGPRSIGIFCYIRDIKVDLVKHPYLHVNAPQVHDGIRIASDADIAAMKVQAMLKRATKKDFWDMAELLKVHSIADVSRWHRTKYAEQTVAITVPNTISFFDDAEHSADPVSLKEQTWESVKHDIRKAIRKGLK